MRRLFALILIALLLSGCAISIPAYSSETEPPKPPATEPEEAYPASNTLYKLLVELPDGSTRQEQYLFSRFGIGVEPPTGCEYYENEVLIGTETFLWDEHGNLVQATPDWEGGQIRSFQLTYDSEGMLIHRTAYLDDQYQYSEHYTYDSQGRITELAEYQGSAEEEQLVRQTHTAYGDQEIPTAVKVFDAAGTLLTHQEWDYDPQRYRADIREYDAAGTLLRTMYNGYHQSGNLVRQEISDPEGNLLCTTSWWYV